VTIWLAVANQIRRDVRDSACAMRGTYLAANHSMLSLVVLLALATPDAEVDRLQAHFAVVDRELRAADITGLTTEQQIRRASLIEELARYRLRGVFPRNLQFERMTPFFIDDRGVRCAMAHLIETHGGAALVARVAATANNAFVRELAADPEMRAWLVRNGLTVAEAARIQPGYPVTAGARCNARYHCSTGTCEPARDQLGSSFCSPSCEPNGAACPTGLDGIPMECQARGDGFLCVYPEPSPGGLGWPCDPNSNERLCQEACVAVGDDRGVCTPNCSNERACPMDYACPAAEPQGTDYLRDCQPAVKDGCSASTPTTFLLALFGLPLLLRRRVDPRRAHRHALQGE
jgi:uncharacterized protein (TIGR03382 family)